jgi:SHS2 domain-containing protein
MDRKPYEILDHPGDAKIKVVGETKQELFLNAMEGMVALLKPKTATQKPKTTIRTIKIKSVDINSLLVDFLSEVNYLIQTNREIYRDGRFIKFSDTELEAELIGEQVLEFYEEIKAVTYYGVNIKKNPAGLWETQIIFDI